MTITTLPLAASQSLSVTPLAGAPASPCARSVYEDLSQTDATPTDHMPWLKEQMVLARALPNALPEDPDALYDWMDANVDDVGERYSAYLRRREAGGPREMLSNRSHALNFLRGIAPTKLVDGAWLYSSLSRWQDERMAPLIHTYLEELGDGDPAQNHVVMFKQLLQDLGAAGEANLSDAHYVQGAIQLALAKYGRALVPEMIGFNLGYEQLPYHLHISAYELNELGIDPYYFTVHITVDNAGTGHARQAVDAVMDALPSDPEERRRFYARIRTGFALNDLGLGATAIAQQFSMDTAMVDMLAAKSKYGRAAHADYCKVAGRTVNDWLSRESDIPAMLTALEDTKWIVRHQDPTRCRFWQLVQGDRADMFGVFSALELQLIYDWIAGDCKEYLPGPKLPSIAPRKMARGRHVSYRVQRRMEAAQAARVAGAAYGDNPSNELLDDDYDRQPSDFQMQLSALSDAGAKLQLLIEQMSPQRHHSLEGLAATRLFRPTLASARLPG